MNKETKHDFQHGEIIVLETHGGAEYTLPCMKEDGTTRVFDTMEEAEKYASEECQRGIVVKI